MVASEIGLTLALIQPLYLPPLTKLFVVIAVPPGVTTVRLPFALFPPLPVRVMTIDVALSETTTTPENAPLTDTEDAFPKFVPEMWSVSRPALCPAS